MKITYDYYNQGQIGDILLIYNKLWSVIQTYSNDDITTNLTICRLNSANMIDINYKNLDIQAVFRDTTIKQIKYNYPELFI